MRQKRPEAGGSGGRTDWLVIPVEEVALRTGWSARSLIDECKDGTVKHVHRKGTYGFTPEQLDELIARYTAGEDAPSAPVDELEIARRFNAERQARSKPAA